MWKFLFKIFLNWHTVILASFLSGGCFDESGDEVEQIIMDTKMIFISDIHSHTFHES